MLALKYLKKGYKILPFVVLDVKGNVCFIVDRSGNQRPK